MKKILLVPVLLLTISSCTLSGNNKNSSFSDLYTASTHSSITSLDEFSTSLGLNRHESINGSINTSVNVPSILSGSLSSDYVGLIDGRNSESIFKNLKLIFTSMINSGSLSADEVGIISHEGDSYISYKNLLDSGLIPENMKEILKKYENSWMNLVSKTQADMTTEELMGYNIGKNLVTKSLTDIEKYITEYPIWKDTTDLGMSGSLHYWSVEIDRGNITSLVKKLSLDLAGTGMTTENIKNLEESLALVSFSGKIGFDPANPKVSILDGSLTASGKLISNISIAKDENGGMIRLVNSTEKTDVSVMYGKKDNKYTLNVSVKESDSEIGKMSAYIEKKDGKFHELSLEASAQGMTVSLKHTVDGDKFVGKLSAIVGSIEWSGTTGDDRLMALKVDGTAPFGSLSMNLVPSEADTMIHGPILLKAGEETLFSANLALEVAREKFAMILDVISEATPAKITIDITAKSIPSDKRVTAPNSTKSLQDLIKEIDALNPVPEFSEGDKSIPMNTEMPLSGNSSTGTVGISQ